MELSHWYTRKGYCKGPLDLPCKEEQAHELETLIKESEGYTRAFFSTDIEVKATATDDLRHTALLTASSTDVDRDNESVDLKGLSLKSYLKNPILAWGHDYTIPPVGRALWAKLDGDVLKAMVKFAERPADWPPIEWFPDTLFALAQQQILKGISIGFLPLEASAPTEKEIKARPDLAGARRVIRKAELVEISLVPIGANRSGLIESVRKGLFDHGVAKRLGIDVVDDAELWRWEAADCLPPAPPEPPAPPPSVAKSISKLDILKKLARK